MFSTSIIASSTTSPSAITSPAITIVLSVKPNAVSSTTAETRDNGIAIKLMSAVRQSKRKITRISTTRAQPMSNASLRLLMARTTNVAGRKILLSTLIPVRPGFSSSSAASTRRVTSSVFPWGCFSTMSNNPGPASMIASPIGGGEPNCTSATSPMRIGAFPRNATTVLARSSGDSTIARCRMARRWFGLSTKPPDSRTVASPAAVTT